MVQRLQINSTVGRVVHSAGHHVSPGDGCCLCCRDVRLWLGNSRNAEAEAVAAGRNSSAVTRVEVVMVNMAWAAGAMVPGLALR